MCLRVILASTFFEYTYYISKNHVELKNSNYNQNLYLSLVSLKLNHILFILYQLSFLLLTLNMIKDPIKKNTEILLRNVNAIPNIIISTNRLVIGSNNDNIADVCAPTDLVPFCKKIRAHVLKIAIITRVIIELSLIINELPINKTNPPYSKELPTVSTIDKHNIFVWSKFNFSNEYKYIAYVNEDKKASNIPFTESPISSINPNTPNIAINIEIQMYLFGYILLSIQFKQITNNGYRKWIDVAVPGDIYL